MKIRGLKVSAFWGWVTPVVLAVIVTGCSTTPKEKGETSAAAQTKGFAKEQILEQEDVKGKPPTVFPQPLEKVREAAVRSLVFVGCEMKEQQPYFLSGRRPNKFGLFVGSGGESVQVFLYPQSESETHVWVDTDLSFVGMAGQQGWNKQVIGEMENILKPKVQ